MDTATVLSGAASYLVVTTDGVYAFDDVQGMRNSECRMRNAECEGVVIPGNSGDIILIYELVADSVCCLFIDW